MDAGAPLEWVDWVQHMLIEHLGASSFLIGDCFMLMAVSALISAQAMQVE